MINYIIQHHEPDPNQSLNALLCNRTYHKFRWKDVYILKDYSENEAIITFSNFGKNWRLILKNTGEVVRKNKVDN